MYDRPGHPKACGNRGWRMAVGVALILIACGPMIAPTICRAEDRGAARLALKHPICRICNGRTGEFEIDAWGNCYHRDHVRGVRLCHQCDRKCHAAISGAGSRSLEDGRTVCGECNRNAINRIDEAGAVMSRVADELRQHGIDIDLRNVTVMLVDRERLKGSDTALGLTRSRWTLRQGKRQFDSAVIRVLTGLSTPMFENVIAHELMHVWIAQYVNNAAGKCAEEGACQLASDLILSARSDERSRYLRKKLIADDDPIYGDCFRQAAVLAQRSGVRTVLARLRNGQGY